MRDGTEVQGLTRKKDGRWKVSATGQTFVEPDELLAVARFHKIIAKLKKENREFVDLAVGNVPTAHDMDGLIPAAAKKPRVVIRIPKDYTKGITVSRSFESDELWAWLRQQILTRPKYVAERVGIEQIGYLTDLKPQEPSLKLTAAIDVYEKFARVSRNEVSRISRLWEEFVRIVGVETIRDITHQHVEKYEAAIVKQGLAPKTTRHRFSGVRTVLAFAMKRGKSVKDCRAALDAMKMLTVDEANALDPRPISEADFWGIYDAAVRAGDTQFAAMVLLSLNGAFYSSEVAVLRWSDIDLKRAELATRRNKTGVPRVACLWPQTVAALKALPRKEGIERIFHAARGPLYRQGINRLWTTYRKVAGVPDGIVYSQIRDASFTIAARHDINAARLLNGHKLAGAADAYVLRQPQAVRKVCEAIGEEFEVLKHAK
ncbi:MAG: site-specific integrase [Tepidisphaeraceae bacterium]